MSSVTSRPARAPPACIDVRPFRMMTMFLPSSSRTCWLPRWNPSPTADSSTIEITPHMIPNIVRKLRSLFAARFDQVWRRSSMGGSRQARGLSYCSTTRSPAERPLTTSVRVPLLMPTVIGTRSRPVLAAGANRSAKGLREAS